MQVDELSEFQRRLLGTLVRSHNHAKSTSELADRLGTSRVAVASAARALGRRGLLVTFPSDGSMWAVAMWAPTGKGRAMFEATASTQQP